jgi:hypothetical protein
MGDTQTIYDLAFSFKTLNEARNLLARFEGAQEYYTQRYNEQAAASRKHQAHAKTARLYISHFIQVLNMSVLRQEIKKGHKELYDLEPDNFTLPDLTAESAIAEWGAKVINGEQQRMEKGGAPIYNPTIAKVIVHYDIFMRSYERQKELQTLTARSLETIAAMRETVDEVILDIWNQVENTYERVVPNEKRLEACRAYGLIYYYRSGEQSS